MPFKLSHGFAFCGRQEHFARTVIAIAQMTDLLPVFRAVFFICGKKAFQESGKGRVALVAPYDTGGGVEVRIISAHTAKVNKLISALQNANGKNK